MPVDEALRIRAERELRALGIMRPRYHSMLGLAVDVGTIGEPASIDGVRGTWWVDPEQLGRRFEGRTVLLSPLDRLIFDRKRMVDIFDFEYQLEMYKPKAKRRWGYFALPVLHRDALIGKVDVESQPARGALVVHAIHQDVPFSATVHESVRRELRSLAGMLDLNLERG